MVADPVLEVGLDVAGHVRELDHLADEECVLARPRVEISRSDELEQEHGGEADDDAAIPGQLLGPIQHAALLGERARGPDHPRGHVADELGDELTLALAERRVDLVDQPAALDQQEVGAVAVVPGRGGGERWRLRQRRRPVEASAEPGQLLDLGFGPGLQVLEGVEHPAVEVGHRRRPRGGARQDHDARGEAARGVGEHPLHEALGIALGGERVEVGVRPVGLQPSRAAAGCRGRALR